MRPGFEFVTNAGTFAVRTMSRQELDFAVECARDEGWNPGLNDAECFYTADPDGFMVGELNGQPIGSISAVAYGDSFGFIGFYVVRPEWRGRSLYGKLLGRAALERLGTRNVGLDGVLAKQDNYAAFGFNFAYRNIRFQGVGTGVPLHKPVVPITRVPFDQVQAYDALCFPAPRAAFLHKWISQPGAEALALPRADGTLAGYGVVRQCLNGFKIGPLFADGLAEATALFDAMAGAIPAGTPVFLDIPEVNTRAMELAAAHNMTEVFATARMYSKEPPDIDLDRVFGVTTFELG